MTEDRTVRPHVCIYFEQKQAALPSSGHASHRVPPRRSDLSHRRGPLRDDAGRRCGAGRVEPVPIHALSAQPVSLVGPPERAGRALADLPGTEPLILPTPEAALRTSFDALLGQMGVVPRVSAEADDMASGALAKLAPLEDIAEGFYAVTLQRRFPSPQVAGILDAFTLGGR